MLVFSCAAKKYKYHVQERKMLVVDSSRFVVLFDVDEDIKSVNTETLHMEFESLNEALEIFDDRSILKPI